MPIQGLTNTPKAFMKLGNIRKGDRGGKNNAPRDLDHFRVTFNPGANSAEIETVFRQHYGVNPVSLNVRFAYHNPAEVWDAAYECYKQGGLIAKANTDETGGHWDFYRDPHTSEVLVRNGSPVGLAGQKFVETPCDVTAPIYFTSDKKPVYMEPVGRLQVVIPELAHLAVGYFLFQPGSPRDIRNITAELGAYDAIARQYGKTIAGIPFKLIRRQEEVTVNIDGKLSKKDSWVVHLDAGGEWGRQAIEAIERLALPDVIDADYADIPDDELTAPEDPTPMVDEARLLASHNNPVPVTVSEEPKDEKINPLDQEAVLWAAGPNQWNCTPKQARDNITKLLDNKKLKNPMSKSAFKAVVKGQA